MEYSKCGDVALYDQEIAHACYNNDREYVNSMLDAYPHIINDTYITNDVNLGNVGHTLLYIACKRGRVDMVSDLLKRNVDVNIKCGGLSAFDVACMAGDSDIAIMLFVDERFEFDVVRFVMNGFMDNLCEHECVTLVSLILKKYSDEINANMPGVYRSSMLAIACRTGNEGLVDLLLSNISMNVDVNCHVSFEEIDDVWYVSSMST